jgi:20S proteasome alpha/beta subunit
MRPPKFRPLRVPKKRLRFMTICAAALAAKSKAIVCVADKAITYGDIISWESDVTKIVQLAHPGCVLMMSGSEESTSRIISELASLESLGNTVAEIKKKCEKTYQKCVQEILDQKFIYPRLLTRAIYEQAMSKENVNAVIQGISAEMAKYVVDWIDCSLLVCGFDSKKSPFILNIAAPNGIVTEMTSSGFAAIGSGFEYTQARLLFLSHERSDGLDKALYDIFDAKASAEMVNTVGADWDSAVVYLCGDEIKVKFTEDKIDELIERAWFHSAALSPYEKREEGHPDPPPRNWKGKLKKYADDLLAPTPSDSSQSPKP